MSLVVGEGSGGLVRGSCVFYAVCGCLLVSRDRYCLVWGGWFFSSFWDRIWAE